MLDEKKFPCKVIKEVEEHKEDKEEKQAQVYDEEEEGLIEEETERCRGRQARYLITPANVPSKSSPCHLVFV